MKTHGAIIGAIALKKKTTALNRGERWRCADIFRWYSYGAHKKRPSHLQLARKEK
jgi:hypothetical protein